MAHERRSDPNPIPHGPQIQWMPGLADQMLTELTPLLAEEGIDLSSDTIDLDPTSFQAALDRVTARYNMALATPTGEQRSWCTAVLRLVAESLHDGDTVLAAQILNTIEPESPDGKATVAGVIGIGTGLLDTWLTQPPIDIPRKATTKIKPAPRHWIGEHAAISLIALGRKGKAFATHGAVITDHGGMNTLYGTALAITAVLTTWETHTGDTLTDLAHTHLH